MNICTWFFKRVYVRAFTGSGWLSIIFHYAFVSVYCQSLHCMQVACHLCFLPVLLFWGSLVCYFLFSFEVPSLMCLNVLHISCVCFFSCTMIVCFTLISFTWPLLTCPALYIKVCVFPFVFVISLYIMHSVPLCQCLMSHQHLCDVMVFRATSLSPQSTYCL